MLDGPYLSARITLYSRTLWVEAWYGLGRTILLHNEKVETSFTWLRAFFCCAAEALMSILHPIFSCEEVVSEKGCMRKFVGLLLIVAGVTGISGCRADKKVESLPSLTGRYEGVYSVQDGTQVPQEQPVTWIFKSSSYNYMLDTTLVPKPARLFCDAYGNYEWTSGVELIQDPNWLPKDVCRETDNAQGLFQPIVQNGTELLLRQIAGTITKEIRLTKQTN